MAISSASKTPRADAQRNRQRLLEVAVRAFSGEQPVTLEAIAKQAGVGIGTLYRHFPTREALIEAVYRNELERLQASADELLTSMEPDVALRAWMDRFADYVTAKQGMIDTIRALASAGTINRSQTHAGLTAAIRRLLDAGAIAGTLRSDIRADDILTSLTGIFLAAGGPDQRGQAARILDLLMDGLRAKPS